MGIIAGTMLFKVICAVVYYLYYKIAIKNKKRTKSSKVLIPKSSKYIVTESALIK